MAGKNWDSRRRKWTDLVRPETKAKAARAAELKRQGYSVREIAEKLGLSRSRIYELLKK